MGEIKVGQLGEKVDEKVGEKVGEKTGDKVEESLAGKDWETKPLPFSSCKKFCIGFGPFVL